MIIILKVSLILKLNCRILITFFGIKVNHATQQLLFMVRMLFWPTATAGNSREGSPHLKADYIL